MSFAGRFLFNSFLGSGLRKCRRGVPLVLPCPVKMLPWLQTLQLPGGKEADKSKIAVRRGRYEHDDSVRAEGLGCNHVRGNLLVPLLTSRS
jgi:hypothetical protein